MTLITGVKMLKIQLCITGINVFNLILFCLIIFNLLLQIKINVMLHLKLIIFHTFTVSLYSNKQEH